METVDDITNQILRAIGTPIEMVSHNKAYCDRMIIARILNKWKREIISEYFNSVGFPDKEGRLKH